MTPEEKIQVQAELIEELKFKLTQTEIALAETRKHVFKDLHEIRQCIGIGAAVADALCDVMGKLFETLGKGDGFDEDTTYLRNRAYVVEHWCVKETEVPR